MKPAIVLVGIALLIVATNHFTYQVTRLSVRDANRKEHDQLMFLSGAASMANAIRDNPNVATLDGAGQVAVAQAWWIKTYTTNCYPFK